MKYAVCALFTLFFLSVHAFSQTSGDSAAPSAPEIDRTPKFDGSIKTKLETSVEAGVVRFNVRNSRVGLRGDVSPYLSYRLQVEFSNEGTFSPLDMFGTIKPFQNFSLLFGQQLVQFDNVYIITPAEMMFANRAFVGKYFTPGTRDLGAVAQYKFSVGDFPMEGQAGVFNGGRINDPQWTDNPSYSMRLIAGSMNGFRTTAKIYKYNSELRDLFFWGADVHYARDRLCLQAELMNRHSNDTGLDLLGAYVQGSYTLGLPNSKMFHSLTPAARWDAMGYDVWNTSFDVKRITAGVSFGLSHINNSTLRVNYEHYFTPKYLHFPDFDNRDPHVADNKVTVELVVRF